MTRTTTKISFRGRTLFTLTAGVLLSTPCFAEFLYVSNSGGVAIKQYTVGGSSKTVENTVGATGMAFGPNGALYFASDRGLVSEITNGIITTFENTTGVNNYGLLNGNLGIVFDNSGNLYVGQNFSNSLTKATPGGALSNFTGNMGNGPLASALDSSGYLYVTQGDNRVLKVGPSGSVTTLNSGLSFSAGVAIDSSNNVFVSDYNAGRIYEFVGGGSTASVFATLTNPGQMAFDPTGNLFITGNNQIYEIAAGTSTVTVFASSTGTNGLSSWVTVSSTDVTATPEPSTWSMFGLGAIGLFAARRRLNQNTRVAR